MSRGAVEVAEAGVVEAVEEVEAVAASVKAGMISPRRIFCFNNTTMSSELCLERNGSPSGTLCANLCLTTFASRARKGVLN